MSRKCAGRRSDGNPCGNPPIRGATVCRSHGGAAPQVRAKAAVRAEVQAWGLLAADVDPGEQLLRLIAQSAARVERYAAELEALVAESPSLRAALVAQAWGEFGPTGEYIRGLVRLESEERDRLASFCIKAVAAGLAERQVRVSEELGRQVAEVLSAIVADPQLGLTAEQRAGFPGALRRHLAIAAASVDGAS